MRTPTSHQVNGDRVLVTAKLPREAVVAADGKLVAITLDAEDWRQVAVDVLAATRHGNRGVDPDVQIRRVESGIQTLVERALASRADPAVVRRRAVTSVLHRVGDLVTGSLVSAFELAWDGDEEPQNVEVSLRTPARALSKRYRLALGGTADGDR